MPALWRAAQMETALRDALMVKDGAVEVVKVGNGSGLMSVVLDGRPAECEHAFAAALADLHGWEFSH
jgi:microcompartment protein CcmL/EutN